MLWDFALSELLIFRRSCPQGVALTLIHILSNSVCRIPPMTCARPVLASGPHPRPLPETERGVLHPQRERISPSRVRGWVRAKYSGTVLCINRKTLIF
jgi:hypothetical protein